jgi:hypothetical protein
MLNLFKEIEADWLRRPARHIREPKRIRLVRLNTKPALPVSLLVCRLTDFIII